MHTSLRNDEKKLLTVMQHRPVLVPAEAIAAVLPAAAEDRKRGIQLPEEPGGITCITSSPGDR